MLILVPKQFWCHRHICMHSQLARLGIEYDRQDELLKVYKIILQTICILDHGLIHGWDVVKRLNEDGLDVILCF